MSKSNLGLKPDTYQNLCERVDTILHNGALVNHAFTYEQLFEPNVLGSLEVMKLALQRRRKAVTYVSSVGVASSSGPHAGPITEAEDGSNLCKEFPGGPGGYAQGCVCSCRACWWARGLHSNIPALDDAKLSVFGVDTCVGISLQVCLHKVGDGGAVAPVARGVQCARLYLSLQHDFGTQQVGIRS